MKKIGILISFLILIFFISACGSKKTSPTQNTTGEQLSGASETSLEIMETSQDTIEILSGGNLSGVSFSGEMIDSNKEELPISSNKERFLATECNRYWKLNLCIIEKAPLENQEIMKKRLEEKLAIWDDFALADQQKICKEVLLQEQTQEVLEHYKKQGCEF